MSASATRMTWLSSFVSLSASPLGASFFSSPGAGGAASGLPFGKAVLNLPLNLMASAYSVLLGLKSLRIVSPDICARKPSTSCDCVVDLMRSVFFKPSTGEPVNAPLKPIIRLSTWLVAMSLRSIASAESESTAGCCSTRWPRPMRVTYLRSATHLVLSKPMPHAASSLSKEELVGGPPPIIGLPPCRCWST